MVNQKYIYFDEHKCIPCVNTYIWIVSVISRIGILQFIRDFNCCSSQDYSYRCVEQIIKVVSTKCLFICALSLHSISSCQKCFCICCHFNSSSTTTYPCLMDKLPEVCLPLFILHSLYPAILHIMCPSNFSSLFQIFSIIVLLPYS